MSQARDIFVERIAAIRSAIPEFNLVDLPTTPANVAHNRSARIIRNGLAVQCFNIFEDFIRARTSEILDQISATGIAFSTLPPELRTATTVGVVHAIHFQLRLQEKTNHVTYTQDYSSRVSSTISGPHRLADIAFFRTSSNIAKDSFKDALRALSIVDPWVQLSSLASRFGISALPAQDVFQSFANRRHAAAHDSNASISELDLQQSLNDACGLAIAFDMLISRASKLIGKLTAPLPVHAYLVNDHSEITLRFIRQNGTRFAEFKENGKRSVRIATDYLTLLPAATARSQKENGALIVVDGTGFPLLWTTH